VHGDRPYICHYDGCIKVLDPSPILLDWCFACNLCDHHLEVFSRSSAYSWNVKMCQGT
jgi:hypothetical protein